MQHDVDGILNYVQNVVFQTGVDPEMVTIIGFDEQDERIMGVISSDATFKEIKKGRKGLKEVFRNEKVWGYGVIFTGQALHVPKSEEHRMKEIMEGEIDPRYFVPTLTVAAFTKTEKKMRAFIVSGNHLEGAVDSTEFGLVHWDDLLRS